MIKEDESIKPTRLKTNSDTSSSNDQIANENKNFQFFNLINLIVKKFISNFTFGYHQQILELFN